MEAISFADSPTTLSGSIQLVLLWSLEKVPAVSGVTLCGFGWLRPLAFVFGLAEAQCSLVDSLA